MLTLESKVNSLFFDLYHFLIARVGFTRLRYTRPSNKLLEGLFDPGTFFYCFRKYRETYVYVALPWMFVRSVYLSDFLVILGDFCEAKFIRSTSLIFPIVISSYVTILTGVRKTNRIVYRSLRCLALLGKLLQCVILGKKKIMHLTKQTLI